MRKMRNELEVHHISVSRKMKNISSPLLASLCKYILGWCLYMEQKYVLNSMMAMNSQINIFYLTYSSSVANLIGRFTYPFLGRSLLVDLISSTQKKSNILLRPMSCTFMAPLLFVLLVMLRHARDKHEHRE